MTATARRVALSPLIAPKTPTWSVTRDSDGAWVIALPVGLPLLNANQRLHWARKAQITREIRRAAAAVARAGKVPPLGWGHIIGEFRPSTKRRRDPANLYPSFKAAIDGLVDAGVFPDDDDTHVIGPDMRLGDVVRGSQLALILRPFPPSGP